MTALMLGHRCVTKRPPERELAAVSGFFAHALAQHSIAGREPQVEPSSLQWEPSPGALAAALYGRWALVLVSNSAEQTHDVYRVRARVSPDGRVLSVNQWRNLTQTPLGDEVALTVSDTTALFASQAYGQLQGLTLLELGGAPLVLNDTQERRGWWRPAHWVNRLLGAGRAFIQTGTFQGIGRVHLTLHESGPLDVRFSKREVTVTDALSGRSDRVELANVLDASTAADLGVVRGVARQPYARSYWGDTLTQLASELLGSEPTLFGRDFIELLTARRNRREATVHTVSGLPTSAKFERTVSPKRTGSEAQASWPPPPIPVRVEPGEAGEGQWRPAGLDVASESEFSQGPSTNTPFAKTWFRPEPEHPQARLHLVAMDMRRLSIGVQAGYEKPKPLIGPPGSGLLPRGEQRQRVVAVFNGGSDASSDAFGMMVERRLLIPPKAGASTLVVRADGWIGFGTWPAVGESGLAVPGVDDLLAFRQQSEPLLSTGLPSSAPLDLSQRGRQISEALDRATTERSALCRTESGQVYYAWGGHLSGVALAAGLKHAGCLYVLPLGDHPGQGGMAFVRPSSTSGNTNDVKLASADMPMRASDLLHGSAEDFFYVTQSDPEQGLSPRARKLPWSPSSGDQPPPSEWPAIWESSVVLGSLPIRVLRIEPGRMRYAATASTLEPLLQGRPTPRRRLPLSLRPQPLLAVSLGHTTPRLAYGLAFGKRVTLSLRRTYGSLLVSKDGMLDVLPSGHVHVPSAGETVVQLPELVNSGLVVRQATERGRRSTRGAICVSDSRVWLAVGEHDSSDAVAVTLRDLGCETVLELDRGSRHPVEVRRDGLAELAAERSDRTWLWGVGMPMQARTFGF